MAPDEQVRTAMNETKNETTAELAVRQLLPAAEPTAAGLQSAVSKALTCTNVSSIVNFGTYSALDRIRWHLAHDHAATIPAVGVLVAAIVAAAVSIAVASGRSAFERRQAQAELRGEAYAHFIAAARDASMAAETLYGSEATIGLFDLVDSEEEPAPVTDARTQLPDAKARDRAAQSRLNEAAAIVEINGSDDLAERARSIVSYCNRQAVRDNDDEHYPEFVVHLDRDIQYFSDSARREVQALRERPLLALRLLRRK